MASGFQSKGNIYRLVEQASIYIFLILVVFLVLLSELTPAALPGQQQQSYQLEAHAHAMPDKGWAPLTVYYSAFGSESDGGKIVKYDWDLDGNGQFDYNATLRNGYAEYTYSKPGLYTINLRVTDQQGYTATDSVQVEVMHPMGSSVDYWKVFDDSSIRKVTIEITKANWDLMWEDIEAKVTVPADVIIFGERLSSIGLRMRGQFSLRESGEKKPWKIDTDYYIDGQEYQNLKQLLFINNIGDPTLVREKLAYEMMQFAGLPASFTCYVQIWIDTIDDELPPEFWGVYTMIERIDRKFISNRFGQEVKDGNLYKASHAQRGPMDLVYYGDSIEDFPTQNGQVAYGKMTNKEEGDYSDIINLTKVIDGADYETPETFALAVEEVFNIDQFLRYMAVVDATMNWDSYPYTGNNFYLFNNPTTGKFEWIPWDLTWGDNPQHAVFEATEQGLTDRSPLHTLAFEVPEYRLRYAAYLDLLMRHFFNSQMIGDRTRELQAMIAPMLSLGDGDKMYSVPQDINPDLFMDGWRHISDLVKQRDAYIQSKLLEYKQTPAWGSQTVGQPHQLGSIQGEE